MTDGEVNADKNIFTNDEESKKSSGFAFSNNRIDLMNGCNGRSIRDLGRLERRGRLQSQASLDDLESDLEKGRLAPRTHDIHSSRLRYVNQQ